MRSLREAAGVTQEGFGELAFMHRTYVGQLERGEKNASVWAIVKIAWAAGVDLGQLLDGLRPTVDHPNPLHRADPDADPGKPTPSSGP